MLYLLGDLLLHIGIGILIGLALVGLWFLLATAFNAIVSKLH